MINPHTIMKEQIDMAILNLLSVKGLGLETDLVEIFLVYYPLDEPFNYKKINRDLREVRDVIWSLKQAGLISADDISFDTLLSQMPLMLGESKVPEKRVRYLNSISLQASITKEGIYFLQEKSRFSSNLKTERSVRQTNLFTLLNIICTLVLASISTFYIIQAYSLQKADNTTQKLDAITIQMKEQKKTFDSISSNLENLYKAIQATKPVTTRNHK